MTKTAVATPDPEQEKQATLDTSSTEVAVPDAQPPALIDTEADQWGDVGDGDLTGDTNAGRIPLLPLNRKLDGGFADPETGESGIRDLDVILLARIRTRAWWPEPFGKGDATPACRSFDGIAPDPQSPDRQSDVCATCPHAKWNGDDAPACHEAFELMSFLPDPMGFGRLASLRFSGMAVSPARQYWESFNARLPKRPPIAYLTHIELTEKQTDNGTFLVPVFSRVREYSRAEMQPVIAERDRRIEEWRASVAENVQTGGAAQAEQDAPSREPGPDEEPF